MALVRGAKFQAELLLNTPIRLDRQRYLNDFLCYNQRMKTIKSSVENFLSFDVEADGPCAGLYSMVSIGMVCVADPRQTFYATFRPVSDQYIPSALAVSGFSREDTLAFPSAQQGVEDLAAWLKSLNLPGRPIAWSDNPAFDWQFLNYYCQLYLGHNPFGHSCRRIGDFFSGLQHDPRATSQWKRLRRTKHTHNAKDDALGNAEALRAMFGHPSVLAK